LLRRGARALSGILSCLNCGRILAAGETRKCNAPNVTLGPLLISLRFLISSPRRSQLSTKCAA
jgi:hypothetical protein